MARELVFSRRSTLQLQRILTFYDERNGTNAYSQCLLAELMEALQRVAQMPTASSPSDRPDVRFIYLMGFTIIFRYTTRRVTLLSIRSSARQPLIAYRQP